MNKTKIEWCDYTWNPVTGCKHGCPFCYARKIANRFDGTKAFPNGFKPTFHPERLVEPVKMKKPQVIFVVSMGDLFGEWVPEWWIDEVIRACNSAPWHTYIFLTKNPVRLRSFLHNTFTPQENIWFGTSCGENDDSWYRTGFISDIAGYGWNTLLSVEPLKTPCPFPLDDLKIKWGIIGMQTNPLIPCNPEVINTIVRNFQGRNIPVFMKDSVMQCFPKIKPFRKFPWGDQP